MTMIRIPFCVVGISVGSFLAACEPVDDTSTSCPIVIGVEAAGTTLCSADGIGQLGRCELTFSPTEIGTTSTARLRATSHAGGDECDPPWFDTIELSSSTDPSMRIVEVDEPRNRTEDRLPNPLEWSLSFSPLLEGTVAGSVVLWAQSEEADVTVLELDITGQAF